MTKKAILLTFVSALSVIVLAGVLSYVVWSSQPSADSNPPTPPDPIGIPSGKPFVPDVPRLSGDILDDGIVSALDINSIVVHWLKVEPEYSLVDAQDENVGLVSSLDLNQTIKYWNCIEQKGTAECPYLNNSTNGEIIVPPPLPSPSYSSTTTPVASPVASTTTSTIPMPPVPPQPTNQ